MARLITSKPTVRDARRFGREWARVDVRYHCESTPQWSAECFAYDLRENSDLAAWGLSDARITRLAQAYAAGYAAVLRGQVQ